MMPSSQAHTDEQATLSREHASSRHADELRRGDRFGFGDNWRRFLQVLDEDRIREAERSVRELLGVSDLVGRSFVDAGSGSGLFSLAARRLGARVHSFDFDPASVWCTTELRRRYFPDDPTWRIHEASVLDGAYIRSLGTFDVVYSWGVLHHTGAMWTALEQVARLVRQDGLLAVAIYNDQGNWSRRWRRVKQLYCSGPVGRSVVFATCIPLFVARGLLSDVVARRSPLARYREYRQNRGMSIVRDWVDWLGGYPFEVAKPKAVFEFFRERGFELRRLTTCGGTLGCNEFVFERRTRPECAA